LRLIPEPKTIDIGLAARKGPLGPAAEIAVCRNSANVKKPDAS
jgi:hypothetical protein